MTCSQLQKRVVGSNEEGLQVVFMSSDHSRIHNQVFYVKYKMCYSPLLPPLFHLFRIQIQPERFHFIPHISDSNDRCRVVGREQVTEKTEQARADVMSTSGGRRVDGLGAGLSSSMHVEPQNVPRRRRLCNFLRTLTEKPHVDFSSFLRVLFNERVMLSLLISLPPHTHTV